VLLTRKFFFSSRSEEGQSNKATPFHIDPYPERHPNEKKNEAAHLDLRKFREGI